MNNLWVNSITIFGYEIKFYGIIIACGFLVALLLCKKFCKINEMDSNIPYDLILIVFPLAIIGARLYYVLSTLDRNWTFAKIIAVWEGGLAIYGGIIASLLGIIVYCCIKKYKLSKVLDIIVPGLLIAQAMGRWGNFFNQECYGNLITNEGLQWFPFAVYIPRANFTPEAIEQVISAFGTDAIEGAFFNATFFYESFWNFVGFFLSYHIVTKWDNDGLATAFYLGYEGIGRFWIEGLRTDSLYLFGTGIKISQAVSILMLVVAVVWIVLIFARDKSILKKKGKSLENSEKS